MISSLRFVSSTHDSALFVKCTDADIDDMNIIDNDINGISVLKKELARSLK